MIPYKPELNYAKMAAAAYVERQKLLQTAISNSLCTLERGVDFLGEMLAAPECMFAYRDPNNDNLRRTDSILARLLEIRSAR